jgi:hypothetical protein
MDSVSAMTWATKDFLVLITMLAMLDDRGEERILRGSKRRVNRRRSSKWE